MTDKEEDVGSYWITLRKGENNKPLTIGSTRSHYVEKWAWKRLWTM
jgi:hypothetical protein